MDKTINLTLDLYNVQPTPPSAPAPITSIVVPDDGGRYMRLVDDWETALWNFRPRSLDKNYKKDPPLNALPATVPTRKLFYALNREWQFFYFELMRRATFGTMTDAELLDAYIPTTRDAGGWRDRHTWNNVKDPPKVYADYVLGLNLDSPYGDAAQQDLLSSANIVKVIGELNNDYIIETLDPFQPPPSVDDVWGKWWLVGFITLSAYDFDTEEKARLKQPFFNGYGCPLMSLGKGGQNRVPKFWCKPVEGGQTLDLYLKRTKA